ncbi:MAG TPA: hypothetical protein VHI93_05845 [Candidatus Thermoplasmatota archaeon]|nr:hypothetical protein [Candidatus Thermoplasmatota archaeon]
MPLRTALPAVLLAALLVPVAGCLQEKEGDAPGPAARTVTALAGQAGAGPEATAAPSWAIGQSWTHKWTIVDGGNLTLLVKTVVAEAADGGWTLATDNQTIAAFHGAFVFPTLGRFTPGLLQTAGPTRFPWYHFPLTANATWSDTAVLYDGVKDTQVDVQGRVVSVQRGPSTVYTVELTTGDRLLARYDYDAHTQWFNDATFYGQDGKPDFTVQMQETGRGFKGRLYDDTGVPLLNHFSLLAPAAGEAQPRPSADFMMAADQNRLLVFLFSFAAGGAHDSELIAPDGTRHSALSVDAVAAPVHDDGRILLLPGQAGTWRVATAGAGAFAAGAYVAAYGLHERTIDL